MNIFYIEHWGAKGNASAGIEIGRRSTSKKIDWPACNRWKWVATLISFTISIWNFEMLFRFYHPNDWRCWALRSYPLPD